MRFVVVLCLTACAVALDPMTLITIAAKSKAANEIAGGVTDILNNLNKHVSNAGEDTAQKVTQQAGNLGIYQDLLRKVQSGQISKRGLIPERDEVLEKLASLYDRVRAYVNGGAEAGVAAYEEALDQLRETYERFSRFKSLAWLKRWVRAALDNIEEKLDEYEQERAGAEKREVIPPREEVQQKFEELYDRIRSLVNERADSVLDSYRQLLDRAREAWDKLDQFSSLAWLKSWIVSVLNKIDEKLQEYAERRGEEEVEKREIIPTREELKRRLENLYDRFRAYVNAGADTASDAYEEGLDYISYLLERADKIKSLNWIKKWLVTLLDRAEQKLNEYEAAREAAELEKREIIPTREELKERLKNLYDRFRAYVNAGADTASDAYQEGLDYISYLLERADRIKSLNWIKKWLVTLLDRAEQKLNEYEAAREAAELEKREIIPTREELKERLKNLYDRFRAYVNAGADTASDAYQEGLDYISYLLERADQIKSLNWIKKWLVTLLDRAEQKLNEYEAAREAAELEKREIIPTREELKERLKNLYDRFRAYVNAGADTASDAYQEGLDYISYLLERADQIKSLNWIKKWLVTLLDRAEQKLNEYEAAREAAELEKREIIPTREELKERLKNLYDRFRAYVNAGADTASDAYQEGLDYISYLLERADQIKSLNWIKKWLVTLLDRAEQKLNEYEAARAGETVPERRDVLPPKEEVLAKIAKLYDRIRNYVNGKTDDALDMYKDALDEVRSLYERVEQFKSLSWLKKWAVNALNALENKLDEYDRRLQELNAAQAEEFHEVYRRDLTSALEEHFDARTARSIGDTVSNFFKNKWAKINQTFRGFADDTKNSWHELVTEMKPILDSVQSRGTQILDNTKTAAMKIREAAISTIDTTIMKMLQTANSAVRDGKLIVDTLKNSLEGIAKDL